MIILRLEYGMQKLCAIGAASNWAKLLRTHVPPTIISTPQTIDCGISLVGKLRILYWAIVAPCRVDPGPLNCVRQPIAG
jgi:hypothetical protein